MWVTISEVRTFTGINPPHLKYKDNEEDKFNATLVEWITQAEDMIKSHTHNNFDKKQVPGTVKNVCLRLVSNIIALAIERRDTPRTKVNDWTIKVSSSAVFTDDLKEDLAPFVIDRSNTSDKIDFFAITGKGC